MGDVDDDVSMLTAPNTQISRGQHGSACSEEEGGEP